MFRVTTAGVVVAALFGGAVAAARPVDTPPGASSPVAKVVDCTTTSPTRSATFYGRVDAVPGASKLAIRFTLLERLGRAADFTKLDLPALRQWHVSQAGVQRFGWKQTVDNLRIGGAYKARVQYRWLSATGAVVDTQTRDTPLCRGPLPNIAVDALTARDGPTPDTMTYQALIVNNGKADADGVDVALSVDHAVLDTQTIDHLPAGESRTVTFTGPVCRQEVSVAADPSNVIGERTEDDNTRVFACP